MLPADGAHCAVNPAHQGKGIGAQIWKYLLDLVDGDGLPPFIIALPALHSAYLKLGFEDVDYCDLDLNAFDRLRYRGFGIYRQYSMCRRPSGAGKGAVGRVRKLSVKSKL